MAGISVTALEVERVSHKLGEAVEGFFSEEADLALSESVISIKAVPVPKMYVCMDGTGVPVDKKETAGRKGKGENGCVKTREVKLGCVFTQMLKSCIILFDILCKASCDFLKRR